MAQQTETRGLSSVASLDEVTPSPCALDYLSRGSKSNKTAQTHLVTTNAWQRTPLTFLINSQCHKESPAHHQSNENERKLDVTQSNHGTQAASATVAWIK